MKRKVFYVWVWILFCVFAPIIFVSHIEAPASEPSTYALSFDSSQENHVEVPSSSSLKFANYSVIMWFNPSAPSGSEQTMISKRAQATGYKGWSLSVVSDSVKWASYDTGGAQLVYQFAITTGWHWVAVRYNSTNGNIWVDGVDKQTAPESGLGAYQHDSPLLMGCDLTYSGIPPETNYIEYYDGYIDEILIYNRFISEEEITYEWNSGVGVYAPLNTTGLVWWKMDEGMGTSLYDRSGNANHGTLLNGTTWSAGYSRDWYDVGTNEIYIQPDYNGTLSSVSFSSTNLFFYVSGASGSTSTSEIYCGSRGEPETVMGADFYSYNSGNKILTVTIAHSSSQQVILDWIVPSSLITSIRSNYYLVFTLISLMPLMLGVALVIGVMKGRESFGSQDVGVLISLAVTVVLAFIVTWAIMNALIGA